MDKPKNIFILGVLLFLSIVFSYIILEDTIGGAKNDFIFHKKFIILFAEDLKIRLVITEKVSYLLETHPFFIFFYL